MLNTKHFCRQNEGFTLIELILVMALSSLIVLPLLSILNLSNKSSISTEEKADLMLNASFAINYVKQEIKYADTIISSDGIQDMDTEYPTNIGFVIKFDKDKDKEKDKDNEYRYITYYSKNNKLIRIACSSKDERYPRAKAFAGHNEICEYVENINNSKFDGENSIIKLDFVFDNNCNLNLKSDIYIRCKTDYLALGGSE